MASKAKAKVTHRVTFNPQVTVIPLELLHSQQKTRVLNVTKHAMYQALMSELAPRDRASGPTYTEFATQFRKRLPDVDQATEFVRCVIRRRK